MLSVDAGLALQPLCVTYAVIKWYVSLLVYTQVYRYWQPAVGSGSSYCLIEVVAVKVKKRVRSSTTHSEFGRSWEQEQVHIMNC